MSSAPQTPSRTYTTVRSNFTGKAARFAKESTERMVVGGAFEPVADWITFKANPPAMTFAAVDTIPIANYVTIISTGLLMNYGLLDSRPGRRCVTERGTTAGLPGMFLIR